MAFTGQLATADARLANLELGGSVTLTAVPTYPKVLAEINWDSSPTIEFPPVGYTDVTNRVRSFSVQRGRNNFVDRVEAGTATVAFDNRDGYFNFTQSGRLLMRKVRLQAFYDGTFFPLLVGHIESYRYSYPGTDKDAVCELTVADGMKVLAQQQFPTTYTRENETPAARLTDALTTAGIGTSFQSIPAAYISTTQLAPVSYNGTASTQTKSTTLTNLSASATVADTSGLVAGMTVTGPGIPQGTTILAVTSSTTFTMSQTAFLSRSKSVRGNPQSSVLEGIQDANELSIGMTVGPYIGTGGHIFGAGAVNTATITAVDSGSITITPQTRNVTFWDGASPTSATGAYINACPFAATSPATLTYPKTYLQAQGILDHIRQVEATERGTFLVLGDGTYQYQGNAYRPAQTVQLTFGENTGSAEIPYEEAPIVYDDTLVTNEYVLNNAYNQTATTISDSTSQARYFKRSQAIDQQWFTNTTSLPTEQRLFEPIPRMEGLRAEPRLDPLTNWRKL